MAPPAGERARERLRGFASGELARERLRGRIFFTEKGCLPNGRQPFPEENKENTRPKGLGEYQNILSSL